MPTTFAERLANKLLEFGVGEKRDGKTPDSGLKTPDSGLKTPDSGLKTPDSGLKTPKLAPLFMSSGKVTAPFEFPKPPKLTIPPPPPINIIPSEQGATARVTPTYGMPSKITPLKRVTSTEPFLGSELLAKKEEPSELLFSQNPTHWLWKRKLLPEVMFSSMIAQKAISLGEQGLPAEKGGDEAMARMRERFANDPNPIIRMANTPTVLGGLTPADLVGLGLIAYGGYLGIKSLIPVTKDLADKTLQMALNTGLDKWIAQRSRGVPPQYVKTIQNFLYNNLVQDKVWLQQRATENMLNRMGRGVNAAQAARVAVDDTISNFEGRLTALVPRGTQTGAMAFGGRQAGLTKALWDATPVAQRVLNAQSAGLSGQVGSKAFEALTPAERTALGKVTAPVTPAPEVRKQLWEMTDDELLKVVDLDPKSRVVRFPKGGTIISTYPKYLNYKEGLDIFRQTAKKEGLGLPAVPKAEIGQPEAGLQPSMPEAIKVGDVITDGLVNAEVTKVGQFQFGKMTIDGYRVRIVSPQGRGQKTIINKEDAKLVRPAEAPAVAEEVTPAPEVTLPKASEYWAKDLSNYKPLSSGHEAWGKGQAGFNITRDGKINLTDNRRIRDYETDKMEFPTHRELGPGFSGLYSFNTYEGEPTQLWLYPDAEKNLTPEMKNGLASLIGIHKITPNTPVYSNGSRKILFRLKDTDFYKQATVALPQAEPGMPEAIGRETVAYGPDPSKPYQVRYRLVELDDLIPSHTDAFAPNPTYPKELQPRMRDRAANRLWVQQTAKNLSPEALVGDTHMLDTGLPIVGDDMVVESGNGRILAMRMAQQEQPERWAAYQKALRDSLSQFGLTEEQLAGMRSPVIVRERLTAVDRVRFAQEANQPVVMGMSPLENALQDAQRIRFDNLIIPDETQSIDITLRMAGNRQFIASFLETLPSNERASLLDASGELNLQGMQRIKAAMFARTYPGEAGRELTRIFFESREPIIRNIEDGMMASLPKMAKAEDLVRSKQREADLGISEDLAKGLGMLATLKQRKLSVDLYLGQRQLFNRELTPFQERLLKYIEGIAKSPRRVREFLGSYSDAVIASTRPEQVTMFKGIKPIKEEIFNATIGREEEGEIFTQKAEFVAVPPAQAREPVRVEERVNLPEAKIPVKPIVRKPEVTPEAPAVAEVTPTKPSPQQEVAQLAEQVKAKLAAEPTLAKPEAPKTPAQRRDEIKSLLAEPAKNLPKGTTKIALRNELAQLNKSLIPQEKKLRQQIMAVAKAKSLPEKQYRDIFKSIGGSRQLSTIGLPELEKVFKAVQRARPRTIGGKKVASLELEQQIQDTKQKLNVSNRDYEAIKSLFNIRNDRFIDSRNFISQRDATRLIKAMKRKSLIGFADIEEAVKNLVFSLGPPTKMPTPITRASFDVPWGRKLGDKINSFLARTYRVERILDKLDGKDNGPLWSAFYKPLNEATTQKVRGYYGKMKEFRNFITENNINLSKLLSDRVEIQPGLSLSSSEKIGVYLSSLNPDNLRHLKEGNKFTDETIDTIKNSLSEQEKQITDWLKAYFENEHPAVSEAKLYVTDEPLDKVENYFPIRLQWKANPALDYWEQIAREDSYRFATDWASAGIPKGFTKPRTQEAIQAVDLDALSIFLNHLEAVEHYKAFAPVIADLQIILKNNVFRSAFIDKAGRSAYQVLDKWLKQTAEINPLRPANQAEALIRTMRVNATTAVLGLNLTTAMKQFPSFVSGAAETGVIPALNGLLTYGRHPVETRQLIKQFSPQIYQRSFEREIAEAQKMRGPGKILAGKLSVREVFMIMTTTMDKMAVSGLWRGSFDDGVSKGLSPEQAAAKAEEVIRKTQPFFDVKDLPEYYRSGEFMKALTIFTNQLNNYWNYYTFDIAGKYGAGRISTFEVLKRVLLAFVIPALMIGAISRSRPAKNVKELIIDLASMGIATIPLAGSWITSGIKGFTDNSLITTELASEIASLSNKVTRGKWDTMWQDILTAGGYATGVPVAQTKRTIKAMVDLATDKTDDWLELIWGKYVREEAEEKFSETFAKDFAEYDKIPSNPDELRAAMRTGEVRLSRSDYREANPDVDAKLFIAGQVSTIKTREAYDLVKELVKQQKMKPTEISAVRLWQQAEERRKELGIEDETITLTEELIQELLGIALPFRRFKPALEEEETPPGRFKKGKGKPKRTRHEFKKKR